MKTLMWMCDMTRLYIIRNEFIRKSLIVTYVVRKMKKNKLKQCEHMDKRNRLKIVKMIGEMQVNGKQGRDNLMQKNMKVIRESLRACGVDEEIMRDKQR